MQKRKKTIKIYNQFKYIFVLTFRNFFVSKRFRNYKKIDQLKIKNYIQCENVKFEKFSTTYNNFNKFRNILI